MNLRKILRESIFKVLNEQINIHSFKSKKAITDAIYDATRDITSRSYHDDYWQGVRDIGNALDELGIQYDVTVPNGGYKRAKDGGEVKEYYFTMDIENEFGKVYHLEFILVCMQAGSVQDPWDRYDMVFYQIN